MHRSGFKAFMLGAALLAAFGCGGSAPEKPLDEVRVQLKWVHQSQFAGYYMAQAAGDYARENLRVTFLEGGQGVDLAQRVLSGEAEFGVMSPEDILLKRSEGHPLVALAAVYRRSAVVFASLAGSGIERPADILGKSVGVRGEPGAVRDFELQFYAMMRGLGLDPSAVNFAAYDPAYTDFLAGKVHVTPCFSTGGLIRMRLKGVELNLIWPADYGVHFYSDTLAATQRTVAENPDLVLRFLRATLKGWQRAVGDPDAAVAVVMQHARGSESALQKKMMEALLPLVHTGMDRIGWMLPERWAGMYRVLLDQGLLAGPFDVADAYTLDFLKGVYGGDVK